MARALSKEILAEAEQESKRYIQNIQDLEYIQDAYEKIYMQVKAYVLCRYLLDEEDYTTENIKELAEISIVYMLASKDKSLKLSQASLTCTGVTSTDTKKVLLVLSLQRALGIKIKPDESAQIETVPALAEKIQSLLILKQAIR
jgi:hypothetical protein